MNTPAIVKPLTKKSFSSSSTSQNIQGEYFSECFADCFNDDELASQAFNIDYWQSKNAISGSAQGRGTTYFIQPNNEQHWVLRHYYRGGLIGKFNRDSYIYTGLKHTRAAKEFTLLQQLHVKGLPVPMPVAYRVIKKGCFYQADLLSQRIENAKDLVGILSEQNINAQLWGKIGSVIKSFHDNNVYHHDLNAHNILIDVQEKIWIIDFDQGEIKNNADGWKKENISRLKRSFLKEKNKLTKFCWEEENWQQLLKGYQF